MNRDEIVGSVRTALTSLRMDEKGLTRSKVTTHIKDRVPNSTVDFHDDPSGEFHVTGSVSVGDIDPVQFRIAI